MTDENKNIENNQEENQNRQECNKSWWKNVGLKHNLKARIKILFLMTLILCSILLVSGCKKITSDKYVNMKTIENNAIKEQKKETHIEEKEIKPLEIATPEECKQKGLHYIGEMNVPRVFHKTIKLKNNDIVIVGGYKIIKNIKQTGYGINTSTKPEIDYEHDYLDYTSEKSKEYFNTIYNKFYNKQPISENITNKNDLYIDYITLNEYKIPIEYRKNPNYISQINLKDGKILLYNRACNAKNAQIMYIYVFDIFTKKYIKSCKLDSMGKHHNVIESTPEKIGKDKILFLGGIQYKACDNVSMCLYEIGEKYYCKAQIYDISKNKIIKKIDFLFKDVLIPIKTIKLPNGNILILERNQIRQIFNSRTFEFERLENISKLNVYLPNLLILNDNQVLITGGIDEKTGAVSSSAWIYTY